MSVIPTWRTIDLGRRRSGNDYLGVITDLGMVIGRVAKARVADFAMATIPTTVEIAIVTSGDLGLSNNTPMPEICSVALRQQELVTCRPEIVLALREQYTDQPEGEVLWVGTEGIGSKKEVGYFSVGHDSRGRWLTFGCGGPSCWWGRQREALLSPKTQERVVPMFMCECAWSRRGEAPIQVVFERAQP